MSPDSRIGSALMSRRIELGISLEQAARDTNIRARMIELLESGDYSQYPPRGHAIGMLSSYARYLGLNSARIIEAFDDEYQEFEANKHISASANNTRRGVGRFGERASNNKSRPINRDSSTRKRSTSRRHRGSDPEEKPSKLSQSLKSEAQAKDDDRYKTGSVRVVGTRHTGSFRSIPTSRGATQYSSSTQRDPFAYRSKNESSSSTSRYRTRGSQNRSYTRSDSFTPRPSDEFVDDIQDDKPDYFNVNDTSNKRSKRRSSRNRTSSRNASDSANTSRPDENVIERILRVIKSVFSERRTRLIALVFAIIVIAIVIAASILIGTAGNNNTGIISVQGGITTDTTTTEGKSAAHKTITTANGNPVLLRVEVPEGETSVIDISFDGANAYKGAAVGPWSKDFNVTESFSASIGNPKAVTITENGNPIEIAIDDNGSGSLYINIQSANH